MQTANTVGFLSWNIDTGGIPCFLARSWQVWARLRFRQTKDSLDFLSVGFYINAPQQASKEYFTGIWLSLFTRSLRLGYWRPLSHYRLPEGD